MFWVVRIISDRLPRIVRSVGWLASAMYHLVICFVFMPGALVFPIILITIWVLMIGLVGVSVGFLMIDKPNNVAEQGAASDR